MSSTRARSAICGPRPSAGTHFDDTDCLSVRSEISHGSGGGYSKSTIRSKKHTPYECAGRKARDRGDMRAKWELLHKTWGGWRTCIYSNYGYNSRRVHTFSVYQNHGATTPCGDTKYMNIANAGVRIGGTWKGDSDVYSSLGHELP